MSIRLKVVESYPQYRYPGPRKKYIGQNSGEEFRDDIMIPFLNNHPGEKVEIDLGGMVGYPPSFLEEAFGGSIRKNKSILDNVKIINIPKDVESDIKRYIEAAKNGKR